MTRPRPQLDRVRVGTLLRKFDLPRLFVEELGWNRHTATLPPIVVDNRTYILTAIAEKSGMVAYQWVGNQDDPSPPGHATRQKIERQVAKHVHEHVIVFATHDGGVQYWQWVRREPGRPDRTRVHKYVSAADPEPLIQKLDLIAFYLDEEQDLNIVDVSGRVRAAFDVEKVTRGFYERFREEHTQFRDFIEGLSTKADRDWYASLMLNRMMFIYFIQKRGFLAGDTEYLRNRMTSVAKKLGQDKFHSFYRAFLLRLFHEGLGQPPENRSSEIVALIGDVPYLNGGLFDVHRLERGPESIHIPDVAFTQVFRFFDAYQWHLDDRPLSNPREINPDVLGYIFEKYINRRESGAYYTKEDVTGYIGHHTILPRLFDQARADCPTPFEPEGRVWKLLSDDPDRYIHGPVRLGVDRPLPPTAGAGLNEVADAGYGLPTETWREHTARRRYCEELRDQLAAGTVHDVNDVVTLNLDIALFVQDVIASADRPSLVHAVWKALGKLSVLDPTCGSGAFLFAALNILKPVYDACILAMHGFADDGDTADVPELRDFRSILDDIKQHPSEDYYILKSIILNNLYGVDIMPEAVETCKLRLFLRLVAALRRVEHLEPLPDIDFNIRTGNALVGFASMEEIRRALRGDFIRELALPEMERQAHSTSVAFDSFRRMQTHGSCKAGEFATAKLQLDQQLDALRQQLDVYLAGEYCADKNGYDAWRTSHRPFHWCVEFYGQMQRGGFDVVIGNPPYVASRKVSYTVPRLACRTCPDIYAWVIERNVDVLARGGRTGMIVPLSLAFNKHYDNLRRLLLARYGQNWFSSFGRIPSALFSHDVRVRNVIHLGVKDDTTSEVAYTTRIHRWNGAARPTLFQNLRYVEYTPALWKYRIPKINTAALSVALERLLRNTSDRTVELLLSKHRTDHRLHYKKTAYNWLTICRELPPAYSARDGQSVDNTESGQMYLRDADTARVVMSLANGKLMLVFWFVVGDDFHVARWNITEFPFDIGMLEDGALGKVADGVRALEEEMGKNVVFKVNAGRKVGNYKLAECRDTTDAIDRVFTKALGLDEVWEDIELYYSQMMRTEVSEG